VSFIEQSIHGRLALAGDSHSTIAVPPVTVDDLLEQRGWDSLDAIKIDIEGTEIAALNGMRRLHARGVRPHLVFECNGGMLPLYDASVDELRTRIVALGYELFLIDHLRPGILVEAGPNMLQTEAACDYVATLSGRDRLAERWQIEPAFSIETLLARLIDHGSLDAIGYRRYAAQLLTTGPGWLRAEPAAALAARTLQLDASPEVRDAAAQPRPTGQDTTARPESEASPRDMVVLARRLSLRAPSSEPDRLFQSRETAPDELILRGASLHLRAGQLLGVLADPPETASALLRALAGLEQPAEGELAVRGPALLVAQLADVLELGLTVEENMTILAAYFGSHVPTVRERIHAIAQSVGIHHLLGTLLRDTTAATAVRLTTGVALDLAEARVLLFDRMPSVGDATYRSWALGRTGQLRGSGVAIVQVVADPVELLGPADRLLWLAGGSAEACGHPESVLDATHRRQLGLEPPQRAASRPARERTVA
ncbi:MAG: FkbM family methyltransferase, partial [Gaiellaceae bacterium]